MPSSSTERGLLPSRPLLVWFPVALVAVSFLIRWMFGRSTPDWAWPYSAFYKGDAPVWLEFASALKTGARFEWGLPLRPPGMGYLLAWIWNGTPAGFHALRMIWCLLGSLAPAAFYVAALPFGFPVAALAGTAMAASTALIVLSNSVNVETPYLVLLGVSLVLLISLGRRPGWGRLALWSALQGLCCLLRVEHVLFFALGVGYLVWCGRGRGSRSIRRAAVLTAVAAGMFFLPIVPWQLSAWRSVARFNQHRQDLGDDVESLVKAVGTDARGLAWTPGATAALDSLPAFARHYWKAVVAATVIQRGKTTVEPADLDILEEAFGSRPEALRSHPFITLYGPLNFYLANNPTADGGFSRDALELSPPLSGGASRYPRFLSPEFLPQGDLSLWYPPHLNALNHGARSAWRWIRSHPADALRLDARKLGHFWTGASLGATGYGFPIGIAGERRRVDLTVPHATARVTVWRLVVLAAALLGIVRARRRRELYPWLAVLAVGTAAGVLFFGYARLGATTVPVVALLGAIAVVSSVPRFSMGNDARAVRRSAFVAAILLVAALGAESARTLHPPDLFIRGRRVGAVDPYPPKLYIDQEINVRPGGGGER